MCCRLMSRIWLSRDRAPHAGRTARPTVDFRLTHCTPNTCKHVVMREGKDRNLTVRLPTGLFRRLEKQAAAEGLSIDAYLERVLAKALGESQDDAQRTAEKRLLALAKGGLYTMDRPLTREQAHDRLIQIGKINRKRQPGLLKGKLRVGRESFEPLPADELSAWE